MGRDCTFCGPGRRDEQHASAPGPNTDELSKSRNPHGPCGSQDRPFNDSAIPPSVRSLPPTEDERVKADDFDATRRIRWQAKLIQDQAPPRLVEDKRWNDSFPIESGNGNRAIQERMMRGLDNLASTGYPGGKRAA